MLCSCEVPFCTVLHKDRRFLTHIEADIWQFGCLMKAIFCTEICASMHCLLGSFITPNKAYRRHLVDMLQFLSSVRYFYPGGSIRHVFCLGIRFFCPLQKMGKTHAGISRPPKQTSKLALLPVRRGSFRNFRTGLRKTV